MDEGLRPRDIQSRIRSGQSSAQIAAATGMPLDKVVRFEAPVLAERAHVADKARRIEVRSAGGGRTVEELVRLSLRERGIDPDTLEWDSWRRDDGRWTVSAEFGPEDARRSGQWTYDMVARAVIADDDSSRALLDPSSPIPAEERPRLVSVPVGPDEVFDLEAVEDSATVTSFDPDDDVVVDFPVESPVQLVEKPEPEPLPEPEPELLPEPEVVTPPAPRAKPARGKRASVPSWDEILFGGKEGE